MKKFKHYKTWKLKDGISPADTLFEFFFKDATTLWDHGTNVGIIIGQLDDYGKKIFGQIRQTEVLLGIFLSKNDLVETEEYSKNNFGELIKERKQTQRGNYLG